MKCPKCSVDLGCPCESCIANPLRQSEARWIDFDEVGTIQCPECGRLIGYVEAMSIQMVAYRKKQVEEES